MTTTVERIRVAYLCEHRLLQAISAWYDLPDLDRDELSDERLDRLAEELLEACAQVRHQQWCDSAKDLEPPDTQETHNVSRRDIP